MENSKNVLQDIENFEKCTHKLGDEINKAGILLIGYVIKNETRMM